VHLVFLIAVCVFCEGTLCPGADENQQGTASSKARMMPAPLGMALVSGD
jgi:hypothetical protein